MNFRIQTFFLAALLCIFSWPDLGETNPAQEKGCGECHQLTPDSKEENSKGPALFFAGDKFQRPWLENFLMHPEPVRLAGYTHDPGFLEGKPKVAQPHVALEENEAKTMADFLLSLKIPDPGPGLQDTEPLSKGKRAKAKIVFERKYGCISCHQAVNLAGKVRGGISGPSLIDAGNRLQADWIVNWLNAPRKFKVKGRMPVYKIEEADQALLVKYIMGLKKENLKP